MPCFKIIRIKRREENLCWLSILSSPNTMAVESQSLLPHFTLITYIENLTTNQVEELIPRVWFNPNSSNLFFLLLSQRGEANNCCNRNQSSEKVYSCSFSKQKIQLVSSHSHFSAVEQIYSQDSVAAFTNIWINQNNLLLVEFKITGRSTLFNQKTDKYIKSYFFSFLILDKNKINLRMIYDKIYRTRPCIQDDP